MRLPGSRRAVLRGAGGWSSFLGAERVLGLAPWWRALMNRLWRMARLLGFFFLGGLLDAAV